MTFQLLIPTVLTPVVVPVLPDPASAILAVAEAPAARSGAGASDRCAAPAAGDGARLRWLRCDRRPGLKPAYEAGEVALWSSSCGNLGRALLARAGSLDALMPILAKAFGASANPYAAV